MQSHLQLQLPNKSFSLYKELFLSSTTFLSDMSNPWSIYFYIGYHLEEKERQVCWALDCQQTWQLLVHQEDAWSYRSNRIFGDNRSARCSLQNNLRIIILFVTCSHWISESGTFVNNRGRPSLVLDNE